MEQKKQFKTEGGSVEKSLNGETQLDLKAIAKEAWDLSKNTKHVKNILFLNEGSLLVKSLLYWAPTNSNLIFNSLTNKPQFLPHGPQPSRPYPMSIAFILLVLSYIMCSVRPRHGPLSMALSLLMKTTI